MFVERRQTLRPTTNPTVTTNLSEKILTTNPNLTTNPWHNNRVSGGGKHIIHKNASKKCEHVAEKFLKKF
ncbi:MAG: hypothetical protein LUD39_03535 [Opitutae bacterium]|nr:hypothetical protein [Opitutae bacterium]